jgi:NAD(P)-dependent dehydrogenase (short-subunit alcohol dehydrogenase family)
MCLYVESEDAVTGRLDGRVAVITGGAGAIGGTIVERFCQEGASVVVADLDASKSESFVAGLDVPDRSRVSFRTTNALDDADVRSLVADVIEQHGQLDILVPLVGGSKDALLHKMTDDQWDSVVELNLRSTFLACRATVPHMMERGYGKIVLMSSRSHQGNIGQVNYATAKAGIIGFTSALAREMARYKVNVNCVVPGFVDNPRLVNMEEKYRQMRIELNPFKTIADPVDVANAILFLASEDSAQVTGQALHVAAW